MCPTYYCSCYVGDGLLGRNLALGSLARDAVSIAYVEINRFATQWLAPGLHAFARLFYLTLFVRTSI